MREYQHYPCLFQIILKGCSCDMRLPWTCQLSFKGCEAETWSVPILKCVAETWSSVCIYERRWTVCYHTDICTCVHICVYLGDYVFNSWNIEVTVLKLSCYHLSRMEIPMQKLQRFGLLIRLQRPVQKPFIVMGWGWSYRRASGPGCDVVFVLDSDVPHSAHMAVTACSNVVKKVFSV